jgi:hypothetical protein
MSIPRFFLVIGVQLSCQGRGDLRIEFKKVQCTADVLGPYGGRNGYTVRDPSARYRISAEPKE